MARLTVAVVCLGLVLSGCNLREGVVARLTRDLRTTGTRTPGARTPMLPTLDPSTPTTGTNGVDVTTTTTHDDGYAHSLPVDVSDSLGHHSTTHYDELLRPVSVQHFNSLAVRPGSPIPASPGSTVVSGYYPNGELLFEQRVETGLRWDYTLDGMNRVTQVKESGGGLADLFRSTGYDAKVKRQEQSRNGYLTKFTPDEVYRPTAQDEYELGGTTRALGQSWTYDDVARTVLHVDRSGIATLAEADGLGRVTKTTRGYGLALSQVVQHQYDEVGHETGTIDANLHASAKVYDAEGRVVRDSRAVLTLDRMETVSTFDGVGNVRTTKSLRVTGVAFDVRSTYDDLNRAVRVEDATGRVTTKAYDEAGNLLCVRDFEGGSPLEDGAAKGLLVGGDAGVTGLVCGDGAFVTSYTYDELGKQTALQDANHNSWHFVYDAARNLVARLDGDGHLTQYEYDARNRRTAEYQHLEEGTPLPTRDAKVAYAGPDAGFTSGMLRTRWGYDGDGHLADETDPKGQVKHSVYGLAGRLKQVTYSGHALPRALPSIDSVAFTYTGNGEAWTVTESKTTSGGPVTEVTTHGYDALERRASTQRYDGQVVTYGYDVKGNRTLVKDAAGEATTYTYDAADRLGTATTPAGTATYGYWEDGLLKTTTYRDSKAVVTLTEGRQYDEAGRLRQLRSVGAAGLVAEFDYDYDGNGNRAQQVETRGGGAAETTTYGYDDANRLVGVSYPEETVLYWLDATGNRKGEKRALPGVVSALTVAAFAALTPAQASGFVQRQYNAADWLVRKEVPAGPTTTLTYDANGNRVGEGTRTYEWDIRDTLTQVTDGAQVIGTYDYNADVQRVKADTQDGHVEYVLDGQYVLQETGARTRRYHFGEGNGLAVTDASGSRWLLNDAQGSTSAEVGSSTTHRKYDAWGNYRGGTAPTAGEARLGYTGHQYDIETGLTYARARYYDSVNGVFLSRDSLEGVLTIAPSLHRFAYAHNNPLINTDPSGRIIPLIILGGIIAWESLVIHNEVTTGQGLTASSDSLQRQAMAHFEAQGTGALSADSSAGDQTAAVATTTGGQFATSTFFGLPNLVLHPGKTLEGIASIPSRFANGVERALTGHGETDVLQGTGEAVGALGEAVVVAEGARSTAAWAKDPLGFDRTFATATQEGVEGLAREMKGAPGTTTAPQAWPPPRPPLPPYDDTTTHGVLYTKEGKTYNLSSGPDGADPRYRNYFSSTHVEGKAALQMRADGSKEGIVFHNNSNGTCGQCDAQLPTFVPSGSMLRSVPPPNAKANNSRAVAIPKDYPGNELDPLPAGAAGALRPPVRINLKTPNPPAQPSVSTAPSSNPPPDGESP
jgi:RHS repeat-associated protein